MKPETAMVCFRNERLTYFAIKMENERAAEARKVQRDIAEAALMPLAAAAEDELEETESRARGLTVTPVRLQNPVATARRDLGRVAAAIGKVRGQ